MCSRLALGKEYTDRQTTTPNSNTKIAERNGRDALGALKFCPHSNISSQTNGLRGSSRQPGTKLRTKFFHRYANSWLLDPSLQSKQAFRKPTSYHSSRHAYTSAETLQSSSGRSYVALASSGTLLGSHC